MAKPRRYLENVSGINVDTRSDTTRKGYHEGTIPYGAGSGLNVLGPIGLVIKGIDELDRQTNMTREDSPIYHPGLITGEAPTPGVKRINSSWINAANDYIKENKLSTFIGPNGKNYVRLANGNVRTIEALGKEEWEKTVKGAIDYMKTHEPPTNVPFYTRNPTTNINATSGPITKVKGKTSNRGAIRTEDIYKKYGGSINIAPSKRGTFTAAASKHGMSVQEFASKVLRNKEDYSPSLVKKANFARNASKWNH